MRGQTARLARIALLAIAAYVMGASPAAAITCGPGFVHSVVNGKVDLKSCSPCAAKTYQAGDACKACPAGQMSDPASTACCTSQAYAGGTEPSCRYHDQNVCKPGSKPGFTSGGAATCIACPAGTYGFAMRSAQSTPINLNGCAPCPAGETSKAGSTTCQPVPTTPNTPSGPVTCRRGTVANAGATACIPCTQDTVANASHTACVACGPGATPNSDHTVCVSGSGTSVTPPSSPGLLDNGPGVGPQGPAVTPRGGGASRGAR